MNNKVKVLFVALALGAGFFIPNLLKHEPSADVDLTDYCMLSQQVCEQQGVKMKVDSPRVTPLTPITVEVFWPESDAPNLNISFRGKEMNMGVVKFQLEMIKPDVYQGEIILPVCAEDSMTWYGTVSNGDSDIKAAVRMTAR
ncbi:hypothetical protein [Vibrio mediterranei]|uniref:hypothetical protein n=1 Tax=Vibrio mediterranei TaxID=689 RepID=UPI00148B75FB|nr:hypothetical protein [Vibrio mediterranei]NOH29718.1 hypothetical protein [Vibrio mediterranei]